MRRRRRRGGDLGARVGPSNRWDPRTNSRRVQRRRRSSLLRRHVREEEVEEEVNALMWYVRQ